MIYLLSECSPCWAALGRRKRPHIGPDRPRPAPTGPDRPPSAPKTPNANRTTGQRMAHPSQEHWAAIKFVNWPAPEIPTPET